MRIDQHSPVHWVAVALIALLALFTLSHAWGQNNDAAPGPLSLAPARDRSDVTLAPRKDEVGKDVRSPKRKVKKATRRTLERARTGVGGIDAADASSR